MDPIAARYLSSILPPEIVAEIDNFVVSAYHHENARAIAKMIKEAIDIESEVSDFKEIAINNVRVFYSICYHCHDIRYARYLGGRILSEFHNESCATWPLRTYKGSTLLSDDCHLHPDGKVMRLRKFTSNF